MKTIETTVYNFDELSDEAKMAAIQEWYKDEDYPFLSDDIDGFLEEKDPYFLDHKTSYSLSWCQGDGLSFEGILDVEKWCKEKTQIRASFIPVLASCLDIRSSGNCGHYTYAHRDQISMDIDTFKDYPNIEALCEAILKEVRDYYMELCGEAEKYGYSILEYRMSEQEFSEMCAANEYTFLSDGRMKNF